MKPYPVYKASGIEWLGEIPAHWEVKKLKHFSKIVNGSTPQTGNSEYWDGGNIVWLTPNDLGKTEGKTIDDSSRKITEKGLKSCGTSLTPPHSIVLSTRAPIGHITITNVFSCTNQGCRTIVPTLTLCDVNYVYYLLYSQKEELQSLGQGSTFTELSGQNLGNFKIPFPTFPEQRAIAAYLDHKTRLIDTYIAKKQQQVERWQAYRAALINQAVTKGLNPDAPMKASGIEWLGDIPAHWETTALKYILNVRSGEGISPNKIERDEGTYEVYGGNGLLGYTEKFNVNEQTLIIGRVGAKCGNVHLVKGEKWVSDNALVVKTGENYKFLYFLLTAMNLNNLANQNAQPLITGTMIKSQRIGIPDLDEQQAIAAYLDEHTAKIDTLAAATQRQLERLHAYRAALISEVVTGKIDVRSRKDSLENPQASAGNPTAD